MTGQSLADGPAGHALLAHECGQDPARWLAAMVVQPITAHPAEASLFDGAPAVAFVLTTTGARHTRALAMLSQHVEQITCVRLDSAHRRIDRGDLPDKREYDLISGLTGLGAYHLLRHNELLWEVLRYLVRLTQPRPDGLPGWWARGGPTSPGDDWPGGHGNLGIAHGITGPLTLLSLALRHGILVSGQAAAIERICTWLDQWSRGSPPHVWWPETISRPDHDRGQLRQHGPGRPSWCYGTPGIARAQQVAGLALDDPARQHLAEKALLSCATDPTQLAQLRDVSLCHGWAGLLHAVWRASQHNDQLAAAVPDLLHQLTTRLTAQAPATEGLLTGSTGAWLAARTARTGTPPVTQWDTCLLLNDYRERNR